MNITHKYTNDDGTPLVACPECDAGLTADGAIHLYLSAGSVTHETTSRLEGDGTLVDTEDHAVAHGHHAGTECEACGCNLSDYEE